MTMCVTEAVLFLDTGSGQTGDILLLDRDEDQNDRDGDQSRSRHGRPPGRLTPGSHAADHAGHANGQGHVLPRAQHRQRPEIAIPGPQEGQDRLRGQGRTGQGQHDPPIDAKFRGPIQSRRFHQFTGDTVHELAHQKNAHRRRHEGDDERLVGVGPFELAGDDEQRDQNQLEGHHRRAQHDEEQHAFAPKAVLGEAKATRFFPRRADKRRYCAAK
jgi:hypothetical protein